MNSLRIAISGCLFLFLALPAVQAVRAADLPDGWTTQWETAANRAAEENKPIFAVFSATWCAPCQAMVKGIYPREEVKTILQEWVPVYVDVDKHPDIARKHNVAALPTMVYLNSDQSEINRTVGGISSVDKMVELLKTKGGAKFQGGSRSPLVADKLKTLTAQIDENPKDTKLRLQRIDLVLDEVLDSLSMENLELVREDLIAISRLDREQFETLTESKQLFTALYSLQTQPQRGEIALTQFARQFPQSDRTAKLHAYLARSTMQAARYDQCVQHMKTYMQRFPKGGYVDEFNLLLPQLEDFLKLTEGVSFD